MEVPSSVAPGPRHVMGWGGYAGLGHANVAQVQGEAVLASTAMEWGPEMLPCEQLHVPSCVESVGAGDLGCALRGGVFRPFPSENIELGAVAAGQRWLLKVDCDADLEKPAVNSISQKARPWPTTLPTCS